MPHSETKSKRRPRGGEKRGKIHQSKVESRYTVALAPSLANQVQRYAETVDRLGLESQEHRKREFFGRLKENLANDDPNQQDRLIDEFRALIFGR